MLSIHNEQQRAGDDLVLYDATAGGMEFDGERYVPGTGEELELEHLHRYLAASSLCDGRDVLDIASGEGYGSAILAQTARSVLGVDVDAGAVAHAKHRYKARNLRFRAGDCVDIPLGNGSVDLVVCFETLEHISGHDDFMKEARRVLRPNGVLVVSTPEKSNYDKMMGEPNPHHELELTSDEFADLLHRHFPNSRLFGQRVLFSSCLVPLVASPADPSRFYQRDEERGALTAGETLDRPTYLIAVASAGELPPLPIGLYEGPFRINLLSAIMGGVRERDTQIRERDTRIRERDTRIRERDTQIRERDTRIRERDTRICDLQGEVTLLNLQINDLRQQVAQRSHALRTIGDQLVPELGGCQVLMADTGDAPTGDLTPLDTRIERLKCAELRLEEIEASRTWRCARRFLIDPAVRVKNRARRLAGHAVESTKQASLWAVGRLPISAANKSRLEGKMLRVYRRLIGRTGERTEPKMPQPGEIMKPIRASQELPHRPSRERASPVPELVNGRPEVSIVIPVFNKLAFTQQCLDSIEKYTDGISFEVIVVDDHSTDDTEPLLSQRPGIRYLRNETNLGFIGSCNAGAAMARGLYVLMLNNDTEVLTNWLVELVDTFWDRPDAGLVGAKLLYPSGALQEAGGIVWQDGSAWNYGRGDHATRPEYNYLREADYISGACIMLRKSLWDELGGFDSHYAPAYGEDSDLAFRAREQGLKVYYQPMAEIVHYEGVTSGMDVGSGVKAYQLENARKLFERWKHRMAQHGSSGVEPELEKERGTRRRILVIDAVTPTPDKDAGSITALGIMTMCQHLGFKVTFIPESNFTWIDGYSEALARIGVESIIYPYYDSVESHLKARGNTYDAVLVFRGGIAEQYIEILRELAPQAKVIFHTSDLHYLRMEREAQLKKSRSLSISAERTKESELRTVSSVDCTIVHSILEKEILEQREGITKPVVLFPWILDTKERQRGFSERRDLFFIGGYQHPANADAVQHFVTDVWPLINAALPDARFHIVGSDAPAELRALASESVIFEGFVENLDDLMAWSRLSVAPLRYGAGIKGKIATCMAYGVPTVTTELGAEGMSLRDGENVLIANEPEALADAVIRLYRDESLWEKISVASQEFVRLSYSSERGEQIMRDILDVAGAPVDA